MSAAHGGHAPALRGRRVPGCLSAPSVARAPPSCPGSARLTVRQHALGEAQPALAAKAAAPREGHPGSEAQLLAAGTLGGSG